MTEAELEHIIST
jgi:TPR repeat protein